VFLVKRPYFLLGNRIEQLLSRYGDYVLECQFRRHNETAFGKHGIVSIAPMLIEKGI
jgi:hypothetical protein